MPIPNNVVSAANEVYYTEAFKTLVRSEKENLKNTASTHSIVEPNVLFAYRNDFYRLLRHYEIAPHLHWVNAFINDITDPNQDISKMTSFLQVNPQVLSDSIVRSNTVQG